VFEEEINQLLVGKNGILLNFLTGGSRAMKLQLKILPIS